MNWLLLGLGGYLALGYLRQSQINAAIASCGGPMGSAASVTASGTSGCVALNNTLNAWRWYPAFTLNF
jgi:hypothetical protein